jgi:hypothetical protein
LLSSDNEIECCSVKKSSPFCGAPLFHQCLNSHFLCCEQLVHFSCYQPFGVRLIIEAHQNDPVGKFSPENIVKLTEICLQAIQLSLSVVASLKDGESLEGMDDFCVHSRKDTQEFPFKVNTGGAIGTNAMFSSVR